MKIYPQELILGHFYGANKPKQAWKTGNWDIIIMDKCDWGVISKVDDGANNTVDALINSNMLCPKDLRILSLSWLMNAVSFFRFLCSLGDL